MSRSLLPCRALSLGLGFAAALALAACSSEEFQPVSPAASEQGVGAKIEVSDAPAPVTSNPADDLCIIKLTAGGPFLTSDLVVTIQFGAGTPQNFTDFGLSDTNKNGKLDVGETMVVNEGSGSPIGEGYASQTASVSLSRGGKVIATGSWVVKN